MMKKILVIFLIALTTLNINAQNGLESIKHRVEKGQTLYFLSKKYDISVQDIMRFNPQIEKDMIIKDGMILKIFTKPTPNLSTNNYKYHTIEKGQTLYSLSKMYNISVDDLIYLNQLKNPNIGIGDKIIVQNLDKDALFTKTDLKSNTDPAKETIPTDNIENNTAVKTDKNSSKENEGSTLKITNKDVQMFKMLYDGYAKSGSDLNKEKGIGDFLEQSTSNDVYLALVNNIETGQVVRVRNLMNNKVIYLKVVGAVPSKDATNNISIKISKAAARDLKIIDDRFLAEWTWYKKIEQSKSKSNKKIIISDF